MITKDVSTVIFLSLRTSDGTTTAIKFGVSFVLKKDFVIDNKKVRFVQY